MAAETYRIEIPIEVQDKTEPGASSATRKMNAFDKVIEKTKAKMDAFNRTKYSVAIEAIDKVSKVAQRIGTTVKGLAGKAWRITMSVLDKATAPIRGIINLLKNPLLQLGTVIGVSVSMTDTINTFKTFESTMSKVQAVGEMTAEQIDIVTEKAKEMGSTTKFTATEAGEAFTYMAQAGWSTEEMLAGIDGVLALSAADGLDLASTASIVTDTLAAFKLSAKDTAHFADVLAKAAAATNVDVAQMGETFTYVAPIAGAMGYSIEDMSTAIGLMANNSVKGSMAGTALKTAISNMVTPTDEQAELMRALGVSMTDSEGKAKDFKTVMIDLRKGFSKLSETEKTAAASTLFGSYAMSGMLAIMNASEDSFNGLSESIANADGTAQQMSEVMLDNLAGSFTLLQSAADGVKISLGQRLSPYLRQFANWITSKMPNIEKAIGDVMDFVDEKIAWLKETISDFTSGEDWENADIWGKIKIAWDKIVAEPFSQWWNSTGKGWFSEKAESIGKSIGSGLKTGLLALLGIDIKGTLDEGKSAGKSFIDGFKQGFDTEKITEALKEWAKDNKGLIAAAGVIAGGKLLKGIGKGVREGKSLYDDIKDILGKRKGSKDTTPTLGSNAYTTTTMTVTANVVNVYGKVINDMTLGGSGDGGNITKMFRKMMGEKLLLEGVKMIFKFAEHGTPMLTGGGTGSVPSLMSGGSAAAGSAGAAAGTAGAAGMTGTFASIGTALGSGATTTGGAAAAGAGATGGILGIVAGGIKSIVDLAKGIGHSKKGESKDAKTSYISAGTGVGMMGAGAGIGAAIGSVIPGAGTAIGALAGGGIGGIASLFGSGPVGKWLSDATDEGGWLNNTGKAISKFFKTTLPEKWNKFWGDVGDFFTETIPEWWGNLTETVSTFFTETIPTKWDEFWDNVGDFFTEDIPYALGYATGKIETFFTETVPNWFTDVWDKIKSFFTEKLPTWASDVWNNNIKPFFTDTIPGFFKDVWDKIKGFFTETLPTWASDVWNNNIKPFFTDTIPGFFKDVWDKIKGFFTETLPTWASDVWNNNIKPFFTDTIPGFFKDVWDKIKTFFTETLPGIASSIWGSIKGFFTETIPDFFTGVWEKVKSFFGAGYKAGKGGTTTEHATGGMFTQPHMAYVAEAGPESIIPLSPSRRARGIDLWQETGRMLGIRQYANGGITADTDEAVVDRSVPTTVSGKFASGGINVKVEVSANPEFRIESGSGTDETEILAVLKTYIRSMTDDIGDELAARLSRIFENMPVTAS